ARGRARRAAPRRAGLRAAELAQQLGQPRHLDAGVVALLAALARARREQRPRLGLGEQARERLAQRANIAVRDQRAGAALLEQVLAALLGEAPADEQHARVLARPARLRAIALEVEPGVVLADARPRCSRFDGAARPGAPGERQCGVLERAALEHDARLERA